MSNPFVSLRRRFAASPRLSTARVEPVRASGADPFGGGDPFSVVRPNLVPSEPEVTRPFTGFEGDRPEPDPGLLRALVAGWWIVALFAVAAGITTFVLETQSDDVYESVGRFVVAPATSLVDDGAVLESLQTLDRRSPLLTFSEMVESEPYFAAAATDLALSVDDRSAYSLTAVVVPGTTVVRVEVAGPDPQTVADLVNGVTGAASTGFEGLYSVFEVAVLAPGTVADVPAEPQPLRSAGIAFLVGGGVGALLAVAYERRRAESALRSQRGGYGQTDPN